MTSPSPNDDWLRALKANARFLSHTNGILPVVLERGGEVFGARPALIGEDETLSHRDLAARMRRHARWALERGLKPGDVVAFASPNRPDYFALWNGLSRVGVVVALIHPDLAGEPLAHALRASGAKCLLASPAAAAACTAIAPQSPLVVYDGAHDRSLAGFSGAPFAPGEAPAPTLADPALLIFTSGTTGLPKAARVSHRRALGWATWFSALCDLGPDDRTYACLPMNHSVGGVAAVGPALIGGGSTVIRAKFSASRFWRDVVETECTVFQYIGELCRYLLNTPPDPIERGHRLRLAIGNGMSGDVWRRFVERYRIPRVLEFYAATEANFSLYNVEGEPGAIGRIPSFLAARAPVALVRFDEENEAPLRGPDGRCIACGHGEIGEAIGRIEGAAGAFEGYTDTAASGKKILRHVFASGDAWMRSGDLMTRDVKGFFRFVDRVGETFRWKGENIATAEVAAALCACPGVNEAVVYGVRLPGAEGRAGMAMLVVEGDLDWAALARASAPLPAPARPLFLRLTGSVATTATFKPTRARFAAEGFDPEAVSDPVYVFEAASGRYARLDAQAYSDIMEGRKRL